jgi:hypothetical protein
MRLFALAMLLLGPGATSSAAADAVDVSALVAALDSDDFAAREAAQQAIVARGIELLDAMLASKPADKSSPHAIHQHVQAQFAKGAESLEREIYNPLQRATSLEAKYRAAQIRATLEQLKAASLERALAHFPARLPPDEMKRVSGYTGGFRDEGPWFDGTFHNDSNFTVTAILALIRTTHKETGEVVEREVLFTEADKPIAKGEMVDWSADVGMRRTNKHNYFWDIVAVYGHREKGPAIMPVEPEMAPMLMHLLLPHRR